MEVSRLNSSSVRLVDATGMVVRGHVSLVATCRKILDETDLSAMDVLLR
jgi:hypothetical protein